MHCLGDIQDQKNVLKILSKFIGSSGAVQNGPGPKINQMCASITGCRVTFRAIDWIWMAVWTLYYNPIQRNLHRLSYSFRKLTFFESDFHQTQWVYIGKNRIYRKI